MGERDLPEAVLELIRRRSVTLQDIVAAMGVTRPEAQAAVDALIAADRIKKVVHGAKSFYRENFERG